ncbi:beta-1,4-glucuronyltransferase 1 [Caerostris extrusa]|uniref:Beta-1,4-glucuronyltransferase 1 n=1 Tax=Caerostris extrusa TaxID=172846 RepID=A0AAV4U490_CAEEX|nr:beta-1,4-glucuronyltransferase 1 [Caerostris extrusa]
MLRHLKQWVDDFPFDGTFQESTILTEEDESTDALKVWTTVKRSKKYHQQYWEPFFIGTRDDPEFDPRLSWEGKQNKMQVAYEMCLRKYDFHIVENAFLVHSPGINVYNASKEKYRTKYQHKNNKWMSVIKKDLGKKYGHNKDC